MNGWNNWRKKKKELLSIINSAITDIENIDIIEARDKLKSVVEDITYIINLVDQ